MRVAGKHREWRAPRLLSEEIQEIPLRHEPPRRYERKTQTAALSAGRFDAGVCQSSPQLGSARQFWQEAQLVGALSVGRGVGLLGVGHGKSAELV